MTLRAIALFTLALASASPARADEASAAQFHYQEASRHYAARRYREAIEAFFLVRERAENPRIDYNLALCFDQLHRRCRGDRAECDRSARQAFHWYTSYLASDDDDAERRGAAEARIGELRGEVAIVAVTSDPPGADVYVDRREIGSYGATPRTIALEPGAHTLIFQLDGHLEISMPVEAVRGQTVAVEAALVQIVGTLTVRSSVAGRVTVRDAAGREVAAGDPPLTARLPPATYRVEIAADGHRAWDAAAEVAADAERVVEAHPIPLPAPTADLTVTANVTGALLALDGEPAGFTPAVLTGLPAGAHELRIEHAGLSPLVERIELVGEERGWLTATLEPPPRVVRSDFTWLLGGVGIAALLGGAGTGVGALVSRDELQRELEAASSRDLRGMRDLTQGLGIATDVLLSVGVVSLAVATLLYFVTEEREDRRSRAVFSRGAR